jgi:hypothetical protein
MAPYGFIINRRFGGMCHLHLQGRRNNPREDTCYLVAKRLTTVRSALKALNEPGAGGGGWAAGRSNQRPVQHAIGKDLEGVRIEVPRISGHENEPSASR